MKEELKCWKPINESETAQKNFLYVDGAKYTLHSVSDGELENGKRCLEVMYVERKYKVQVAGLGQVYYEMRSENQELELKELIFKDGICIGAYHDELIFLWSDEKTHYQEKYLGEMPTGPDRAITFYDYYYLRYK